MRTLQKALWTAAALVGLAMLFAAAPAVADVCYNDDLIVDGSLCVGFDCVCNYAFGFDTIVLKENNLRIFFDDTSVGSFPSGNWRIRINDSSSGGSSYFAVEDANNSTTPFRVTTGARNNALFVDAQGDVGIGTSTPVLELHAVAGDSPGLRLEQNSSSGFTPQTWDVVGNETNFFVRDVTNGSKLPFRIRPNAPSSSLFVDTDGDIGLGTSSPGERLHVNAATDVASIRIESTFGGGSAWRLRANAVTNQFVFQDGVSNDAPIKVAAGSGNNRIFIASTGAVGINTNAPNAAAALDVNGPVYLRGAVLHADYVFEPSYELESIEEHAEAMWRERHLPAVSGRMVNEDGQEIIELGADRRGFLEELEKAHIYIEQLHATAQSKDAEIVQLRSEYLQLRDRLGRLEAAAGIN